MKKLGGLYLMIVVYRSILKSNLKRFHFFLIFKTMDRSWDLPSTCNEVNRRGTVNFHDWSRS